MGGSSKKDKSSAEQGIQQAGSTAYSQSQMTPQETKQYSDSFQTGDLLTQLERYRAGLGGMPSGYQTPEQQYQAGGPLAQSYYQQTLAGSQDPYAAFESSLNPQLQLAQDTINRSAASKGLLRSGIPIEQMGRAGVELAIKEAQNRMAFRDQELARAGQLSEYTNTLGQQNVANLQNLYGTQQQAGLQGMNRQANAAWQNASYQAYPSQAALGDYYGSKSGMQKGLGTIAGGIGGLAIGSLADNPLGGAMIGAGIGSSLGGGSLGSVSPIGYGQQQGQYAPQTAYDYQAGTQNKPLSLNALTSDELANAYPWRK